LASLPRGDKVICNVICVPEPPGRKAKGRKPYHATASSTGRFGRSWMVTPALATSSASGSEVIGA
jgi:hypothetical protein